MSCDQVVFTHKNYDDPEKEFGGIALFDHLDHLQYVICGCCGNVYPPSVVEIKRKFASWNPISDEIIGE